MVEVVGCSSREEEFEHLREVRETNLNDELLEKLHNKDWVFWVSFALHSSVAEIQQNKTKQRHCLCESTMNSTNKHSKQNERDCVSVSVSVSVLEQANQSMCWLDIEDIEPKHVYNFVISTFVNRMMEDNWFLNPHVDCDTNDCIEWHFSKHETFRDQYSGNLQSESTKTNNASQFTLHWQELQTTQIRENERMKEKNKEKEKTKTKWQKKWSLSMSTLALPRGRFVSSV